MNVVSLIGRLTATPELKKSKSGKPVVSFSVAVPRNDKDKNTDFINCVAWDKTAEFVSRYFQKGNRIGINGRLQVRSYEKDGKNCYVTEVIISDVTFCESKNDGVMTVDEEL